MVGVIVKHKHDLLGLFQFTIHNLISIQLIKIIISCKSPFIIYMH